MLQKFCEVTSCNGVIDLYEARNNKRHFYFWCFIMAMMGGSSVYFTYATIKGYIESPTVTKFESVPKSKLDMPEVVICNSGGMNISAMLEANFSKELIAALMSQRPSERALTTKDELTRFRQSQNIRMRDVYVNFSFPCESMIKDFHTPNSISKLPPCNQAVHMLTTNGMCYLFENNGQQIYPNGGIEIVLKGLSNSRETLFSNEELLNLRVTNDYILSLERHFGQQMTGRYLNIPMNSLVTVTLNTKRYVRQPKANPCDSKPEHFTSITCFLNCYTEQYLSDCKCLPKLDPWKLKEFDVCDPFAMLNCTINFQSLRECQKSCLPKCEEWIFENTISISSLWDAKGITEDSTSLVSINYNTMQYTLIEEVEAFTMDMAVANVGGQSGLWLGASFVTLIQAVYYLVLSLMKRMMKPELADRAKNGRKLMFQS